MTDEAQGDVRVLPDAPPAGSGPKTWLAGLAALVVGIAIIVIAAILLRPSDDTATNSAAPGEICASDASLVSSDCEALSTLASSELGSTWMAAQGWVPNGDPCEWEGVTCESDRLVSIDYSPDNYSGPIPAELGGLTNLERLNIDADLTGGVPGELGELG